GRRPFQRKHRQCLHQRRPRSTKPRWCRGRLGLSSTGMTLLFKKLWEGEAEDWILWCVVATGPPTAGWQEALKAPLALRAGRNRPTRARPARTPCLTFTNERVPLSATRSTKRRTARPGKNDEILYPRTAGAFRIDG